MGLDRHSINYLLGECRRGLHPRRTITLGHQSIYMDMTEYREILKNLGQLDSNDGYSDQFFKAIGTSELQIMDASVYEGATIIHDLNEPIPIKLNEAFNCVIDGGTLEHVFNFPTAIRNCMEMVAENGALIIITPWHNYAGHGFYQFSPELFYSLLSNVNGFEIERMLITIQNQWYSVLSPSEVRGRVEIETTEPILLYITARRKKILPVLESWPQQSDYMTAWSKPIENSSRIRASSLIKNWILRKSSLIRGIRSKYSEQARRRKLAPSRNKSFMLVNSANGIPLE